MNEATTTATTQSRRGAPSGITARLKRVPVSVDFHSIQNSSIPPLLPCCRSSPPHSFPHEHFIFMMKPFLTTVMLGSITKKRIQGRRGATAPGGGARPSSSSLPRHKTFLFTGLWIALFPFVWFTLQWNLQRDFGFMRSVTSSSQLPPLQDEDEMTSTSSLGAHDMNNPGWREESVGDPSVRSSSALFLPSSRRRTDLPPMMIPQAGSKNHEQDNGMRPRPPAALIINTMDYPIVVDSDVHNQPSKSRPLRVSFWGRTTRRLSITSGFDSDVDTSEDLGEYYRGLQLSRYIQICSQRIWGREQREIMQPPAVEVVDVDELCEPQVLLIDWSALDRECHVVQDLPDNIPIVLLDASASARVVECPDQSARGHNMADHHGGRPIHVAKRSVVANRLWSFDQQILHHGNLIDVPASSSSSAITAVHHMSGLVPQVVADLLAEHFVKIDGRPLDVLHYWNSVTAPDDVVAQQYSSWRAAVSQQLRNTKGWLEKKKHKVGTWLDRFGLLNDEEDQDVEEENQEEDPGKPTRERLLHGMVSTLTTAKIIVVAQSDEYEDHDNRIMEALASGALVMVDSMLAPVAGLQNNTNIIIYESLESLDRLIRYYLVEHPSTRHAIAKRGREYALNYHRSWHVMESLLFGRALSGDGRDNDKS
jgi:Glycosyl transferases group 1